MPLLAITGGIATGKSTFTRLFSERLGAKTCDTDACARRLLTEDAAVLADVRAAFGDTVFDMAGGVNRATLRKVVFNSQESRRALEAILHPRVRAAWTRWAQEELQNAQDTILLVEIPLLYETAAANLFDEAIVVGCAEQTQLRRLTTERRLSTDTARQMIASQWPLAEKMRLGDRLIWNDGSGAALQEQVEFCAHYYQDLYHPPATRP